MKPHMPIVTAAVMAALVASSFTTAQGKDRIFRIGWLTASTVNETFREAIRELGYVEGKNLEFVYRQAKQRRHYPRLAKELAGQQIDVLFTVGVSATRAAKEATRTIPIVMGNSSADPVRQGLIKSLAKPGGNVTGVFDLLPDLAGKRVELLKEIFPRLSRIAHIAPEGPVTRAHLERVRAAADKLGVKVQALTVDHPEGLESAFRAAAAGNADAVIIVGVSFFIRHRSRIVKLAAEYRLPAIYTHGTWVPDGGFVAYSTDPRARYRRAAWYVDRIFKGAKPADMPVEQPKKFLLQVNLRIARALGVVIPRAVLLRADEVIE